MVQLCVFQWLVDGRLPPGCAETQRQEGPRPCFRGQLSPPSARLPGWRLGLSASLLSLQTIRPGSPVGPDSAVSCVSSRLAGRPGQPRVCEPVNPSPAWQNFRQSFRPRSCARDSSKDPRPPTPGLSYCGILTWLGQKRQCGKICQRTSTFCFQLGFLLPGLSFLQEQGLLGSTSSRTFPSHSLRGAEAWVWRRLLWEVASGQSQGGQLQPETTQLSGPPGGTVSSLQARVQAECRIWLGRGFMAGIRAV